MDRRTASAPAAGATARPAVPRPAPSLTPATPVCPSHPGFPALLGFMPGHLAQQGLELGEGIGQDRWVAAALDGEAERPVEGRQFI